MEEFNVLNNKAVEGNGDVAVSLMCCEDYECNSVLVDEQGDTEYVRSQWYKWINNDTSWVPDNGERD